MRAAWVEYCRFPGAAGANARAARDHFVLEHLETVKEAVWLDEREGKFTIFDRTFRIELAGAESDWWKVEELKVTGSKKNA